VIGNYELNVEQNWDERKKVLSLGFSTITTYLECRMLEMLSYSLFIGEELSFLFLFPLKQLVCFMLLRCVDSFCLFSVQTLLMSLTILPADK